MASVFEEKIVMAKKIIGSKNVESTKFFGSEQILGQKKCWVKKIRIKNILKKILSSKEFLP